MLRLPADPLPWTLMLIVALVVSASASSLSDMAGRAPEPEALRASLVAAPGCDPAMLPGVCDAPGVSPKRFSLSAAAFELGSAQLPESLSRQLAVIGEAMRDQHAIVRIEVHTDASGSREESRLLTQRRADAIRSFLIERGVDPYRVQAVGLGSSRPKLPSDPLAPQNRRVEIVRL